jgi:hypothetical protein
MINGVQFSVLVSKINWRRNLNLWAGVTSSRVPCVVVEIDFASDKSASVANLKISSE